LAGAHLHAQDAVINLPAGLKHDGSQEKILSRPLPFPLAKVLLPGLFAGQAEIV
jgi:hypothetical protein